MAVSERHNQAYKETIKLFKPLEPDAPLNRVPLFSLSPGPDDGICNGIADPPCHLVHTTAEPLVTLEECDAIVDESEVATGSIALCPPPFRLLPLTVAASVAFVQEWATRAGGWTSTRHFNHPTIDIPLSELPRTRALLNERVLPERIYPMLGQAFENSLPNWRALRVADAFVVKYDAAGGQTKLAPHRDGSVLSFNIALNERGEYEGGGTWFEGLGQSLPIDKGHVCAHASGVFHGGHPITSGVRYILVAFVICEGYQNWAMRFMKSVWDY